MVHPQVHKYGPAIRGPNIRSQHRLKSDVMGWTSGGPIGTLGSRQSELWRDLIMEATIIGIDLTKRVFQVHGADANGAPLFKMRLTRPKLMAFLTETPPTVVAMEACGSSHFWARYAENCGHEARIISAQYVKPFVKRQKNDAADAAAICEAAARDTMRTVPVKTEEQQALQSVHRMRARLVRDRTALANEMRGLLSEYGLIFPQSLNRFRDSIAALLASAPTDELPLLMRSLAMDAYEELVWLDGRIDAINARIREINEMSEACGLLKTIPGVGELNASAFVAAIGDGRQFKRGRDLAAWLGLVPQQHSTGGKERLGGISKKGNSYLRKILIHGARACCQCRSNFPHFLGMVTSHFMRQRFPLFLACPVF